MRPASHPPHLHQYPNSTHGVPNPCAHRSAHPIVEDVTCPPPTKDLIYGSALRLDVHRDDISVESLCGCNVAGAVVVNTGDVHLSFNVLLVEGRTTNEFVPVPVPNMDFPSPLKGPYRCSHSPNLAGLIVPNNVHAFTPRNQGLI